MSTDDTVRGSVRRYHCRQRVIQSGLDPREIDGYASTPRQCSNKRRVPHRWPKDRAWPYGRPHHHRVEAIMPGFDPHKRCPRNQRCEQACPDATKRSEACRRITAATVAVREVEVRSSGLRVRLLRAHTLCAGWTRSRSGHGGGSMETGRTGSGQCNSENTEF